jgi:thiol:disulfide interchange protein DsbD
MKRLALAFLLFCLPVLGAPRTQTRLILSADSAKPGETIWAGVELKMPQPLHTYWRNGGDSGSPTTVTWSLPAGVTAGEIEWPVPEKEVQSAGDVSLVTYGYKDTVLLLVPIQLPKDLPQGSITLKARVNWLECSESCVPGHSEVTHTLTVGDSDKASADAAEIEQWRARLPKTASASIAKAYWENVGTADARPLVIQWDSAEKPADFYPYPDKDFNIDGKTELLPGAEVRLRKAVQKNQGQWPDHVAGLLIAKADSPNPTAIEVNLPVGGQTGGAKPAAAVAPVAPQSLLLMLAFGLIGGLILNVMPCVLPVIALKVLGFVNQSSESPQRVKRLGLVYGLGVLASFLVLAGLAIVANRAGHLANWGDAFRNSQFQVILTVLITLIALNLFGLFEITLNVRVMGSASELTARHGYSGAFFNGVLATLLATPCTAPFLTAALAFAFTQPPFVTILVFLSIGVGLALPFVIICFNPRLLKVLPKPGAWMEKFKIAMGFPMLGTAFWLLWISAKSEDEILWLGLFLVVLSMAAWIWGAFVQRGLRGKSVAVCVAALIVALDYAGILEGQMHWRMSAASKSEGIDWQVWSLDAVKQAQEQGHPVLVDFTAKSCLTCKLNEASSLNIAPTRAKLQQIKAVCFKADYTHEDPEIGRVLRDFDRPGVPLVLVYSKNPGEKPQVLPPVLTKSIVLTALDQAAGSGSAGAPPTANPVAGLQP